MDKGIPNGNGSFDLSILQDHEVTENALRVYIVLSSAQWLTRKTGMKREDIAELAGISIQQTSHGISCLVKNGWIVQRRIPNKPSRYLIKAGFFAEDDPAAPGFDLGDCEIEKNGCTDSDTSKKPDISKGVQPNQPVSDTAERISDESGVRGEGQGTLLVLSSPSLFPEEVSKSKKESLAEKATNPSAIPYRLAKLLYTEHQKLDPKYLAGHDLEATFRRWAIDIERLIRIDGRDEHEVAQVIRWCQADSFWNSNILSGAKLREKYPQLILRKNNGIKKEALTQKESTMLNEVGFMPFGKPKAQMG